MLQVGQGIFGKTRFVDGNHAQYSRPYLVVSLLNGQVGILNISSTAGKEHKLLYATNRSIVKYNPPFIKDCFVKLDSLVFITEAEANNFRILHNGDCLDSTELQEIVSSIVK